MISPPGLPRAFPQISRKADEVRRAEAARLIIESGTRPKRTIRVVLWTNEENGLRWANHYAEWAEKEEQSIQNHLLAMESDAGVFDPIGFGFSGNEQAYKQLSEIAQQLVEIDAAELRKGGGVYWNPVAGGMIILNFS